MTTYLHRLRGRPIAFTYMLTLLAGLLLTLGVGIWNPNAAQPLPVGFAVYIGAVSVVFAFAAGYDLTDDEKQAWRAAFAQNDRAGGLLVTLLTVGVLLTAGEFYLRYMHVRSHWNWFTLTNSTWLAANWSTNSASIRDREPPANPANPVVLMSGDSLAAGVGIEDVALRYPDQVRTCLGSEYEVLLAAIPGMETPQQLRILQAYPLEPDRLILSYYPNDIQVAYRSLRSTPPAGPPLWLLVFERRYYVVNYVYWNMIFPLRGLNLLDAASWHADAEVWALHQAELDELATWATANSQQQLAVLWPDLTAPLESGPALAQVRAVYESHGIPVLDLTPVVMAMPQAERRVHRNDAHPSPALHTAAAAAILSELHALGWTQASCAADWRTQSNE
jgi:hypothetical protein